MTLDDARIAALSTRLQALGSPERAVRAKAYLKSNLLFWGVALPDLRVEAAAILVGKPAPEEVLALCEALWAPGVHELRALAVVLLEKVGKRLGPDALPALERLLRNSHTWAYVDAVAVHAVGPIVLGHPAAASTLDRWIEDADFWIRRSAILALIYGIRKGKVDGERILAYAERLLPEKEFFLRKAVGWVLRELSGKNPEMVAGFVRAHRAGMAGLTFREATRKLPGPIK